MCQPTINEYDDDENGYSTVLYPQKPLYPPNKFLAMPLMSNHLYQFNTLQKYGVDENVKPILGCMWLLSIGHQMLVSVMITMMRGVLNLQDLKVMDRKKDQRLENAALWFSPLFSRSCIFQPCHLVRHFPGPAFSSHAIWSIIFQVLHFPALQFSVAPDDDRPVCLIDRLHPSRGKCHHRCP